MHYEVIKSIDSRFGFSLSEIMNILVLTSTGVYLCLIIFWPAHNLLALLMPDGVRLIGT